MVVQGEGGVRGGGGWGGVGGVCRRRQIESFKQIRFQRKCFACIIQSKLLFFQTQVQLRSIQKKERFIRMFSDLFCVIFL